MQITHYLQLIVSVVIILGAAAVALICDLLKRNNEQLREMNLELRIRREEEQRHAKMAPAPAASLPAAEALTAPTMALAVSGARITADRGRAALDRVASTTSRRGARTEQPNEPAAERLPGSSLAEARMLAREFIRRKKDRHREEREKMTPQEPVEAPVRAMRRKTAAESEPAPKVMVERPASAAATSASAAGTAARRNWDMLLKTNAQRRAALPATIEVTAVASGAPVAAKSRMAELIPFETLQHGYSEAADTLVPAGFHEPGALTQLIESAQPARGLVIAIGINDFENRTEHESALGIRTLIASVSEHIRSMLRGGDFACPLSENEFVIICPGERDAAAHRRLSELAESLWDFQLRSVGSVSILFSWGAFEAKGEPIADAVASAIERLQETRRSRTLALEAPRRRKAV
jgi:GGDEF domain-containing protein